MIPKIIHQIWFQGCNSIPNKYNDNISSIHKYAKDWQYVCWDHEQIAKECKKYYDIILQLNNKKKEIFVFDFKFFIKTNMPSKKTLEDPIKFGIEYILNFSPIEFY